MSIPAGPRVKQTFSGHRNGTRGELAQASCRTVGGCTALCRGAVLHTGVHTLGHSVPLTSTKMGKKEGTSVFSRGRPLGFETVRRKPLGKGDR